MKTILRILLFILLITQLACPQWTNQNLVPDANDLWSTFFVDDSTGWIVGSWGFIKKTTNAGNEWIQQNSGTTSTLRSVQFVDQNNGWICGEAGLILKTNDGGVNWDSIASGTIQLLTDINFCDLDTGYVVGYGGTILKSTNGGSTWTTLTSGTTNILFSVDFVSAATGWAVGGLSESNPPTIIKTTDGGINWTPQSVGTNSILYSVDFVDEYNGFAVGRGPVIKTTDGGNSWDQSSDLPFNVKERKLNLYDRHSSPYPYPGYYSIFFIDANNGCRVGSPNGLDSYIYETSDAGITWVQKYRAWDQPAFLSVFVTPNGKGWTVGLHGLIGAKEENDSDWSLVLSGHGDRVYSIYFINENIGWAGGNRFFGQSPGQKVVLKTINGGKVWKTQLNEFADTPMRSVYFINELIGWAVSSGGIYETLLGGGIYRTTDGGDKWIQMNYIDGTFVFFINQDNGWVTNNSNSGSKGIYKSTDGGITWLQTSTISSSSVYFLNNNIGWATSISGILKSTDGGDTWFNKSSLTGSHIKFFDSNVGMCVGGNILVSTDGGETWTSKNGPSLQSINFINSTTIWGYTSEGTLYKTTNFGDTWSTLNTGLGFGETAFFINEYTGWVGGSSGTMYNYSIEPSIALTSPNGGEVWQSGWQKNITWTSEYISNVNLYYSTNGGGDWNTIATNVDASIGSYNWTIPVLTWFINLNCKVKIEDASNPSVYDESANNFIIWHFCNIIQYANLGQRIIDFLETNIDISMNVTTADNISANYYPYETPAGGSLPSGVVVLSDYFWEVSSPGISFNNGKMIIPISTLRGVTDASKLVWLKRTNSGDPWENIGGIVVGENLESTVLFNSFSEFAIGSTDPANPLPVELSSFTAVSKPEQIILKWETETETNNYGFEIERKVSDKWQKIGFINGNGNSNSLKEYSYADKNPIGGIKFQYRLKQIDNNGQFEYSDVVEVELVPTEYALYQNYPNPFNPTTTIRYQLPKESKVVIKIYNILGAEVMELLNEQKQPGIYEVEFNSNNLSSGTYIYKISADNFVSVKKMLLVK